jgi:hypothetical protein
MGSISFSNDDELSNLDFSRQPIILYFLHSKSYKVKVTNTWCVNLTYRGGIRVQCLGHKISNYMDNSDKREAISSLKRSILTKHLFKGITCRLEFFTTKAPAAADLALG